MKLSFRPLAQSDYQQFADWLAQPHVQQWWREQPTVQHVEEKYGPRAADNAATSMYVILDSAKPIGIIQSFLWASYPDDAKQIPDFLDDASIDYFIGEPDYIGRGVGTAMIRQFIDEVVRVKYPDVPGVTTAPEVTNAASLRVLEKVGFEKQAVIAGEHGPEQVMRLAIKT